MVEVQRYFPKEGLDQLGLVEIALDRVKVITTSEKAAKIKKIAIENFEVLFRTTRHAGEGPGMQIVLNESFFNLSLEQKQGLHDIFENLRSEYPNDITLTITTPPGVPLPLSFR